MPRLQNIQNALEEIHDFPTFANRLLREALGWPLPDDLKSIEEIGYEWSAEDLRAEGLEGHVLDSVIYQIPPLSGRSQPWGIFVVNFEREQVFAGRKGMAGPLRRILRGLVKKRRSASNLPAWNLEDLLFICTHQWTHYAIVHFEQPREPGRSGRLATFGWSPESPNRTLIEHNLPHLAWPDDPTDADGWRKQWLRAFDKEKLTDEYFEKLDEIFRDSLVPDIQKDKRFENEGIAREAALVLMNRLLFLSFIQRKGWLDGKTDYLIRAFEAYRSKPNSKSFYAEFLWPLFLALATPKSERAAFLGSTVAQRYRAIPFLNGGLFEPQSSSEAGLSVSAGDLHVTNATFTRIFEELLERYNFTVTEDTDLDIEVAVDPEMLGKIFEELVTRRHDTGAYYTPKPIVAFMCREALKGYLGGSPAIERFVDSKDASGLTDPEKTLEKLKAIRVCDPACGSGAYLVGMLHELLALRNCLFVSREIDPLSDYQRKKETIQNSLYGVDIAPTAVSLARLRLWLTLAVDYEGDEPQPLPNLDFKIEANDSLAGPDPSDSLAMDLNRNRLLEYFRLKAEYAETNIYGDKRELKAKIEAIGEELSDWAHAGQVVRGFDWRIEFDEVFNRPEAPGFDVVLANPPYVRHELIGKEHGSDYKHRLLRRNFPEVWSGTADLYCYFYARALQLLHPGGMLAFISSNKWLRASYGSKLRQLLADTCSIEIVADFRDLPVFQSAIAYPVIVIARKGGCHNGMIYASPESLASPYPDVRALIQKCGCHVHPEAISGPSWTLLSPEDYSFMSRLSGTGTPLRKCVGARVYRGITSGLNDAFIVDEATKNALIREDPHSRDVLKPYASNRNVQRWNLEASGQWLIVTPIGISIDSYPAIFRHLEQWQPQLEKRWDKGEHWWELRACTYYDKFEKPKIVSKKMSIRPTFALDLSGSYLGNTTYFLPADDHPAFILACLNSTIFARYARIAFVEKQNGWYEVQPEALEQFSIPKATAEEKRRIAKLAERCVEARGVDCEAWEREIDERVSKLYGL